MPEYFHVGPGGPWATSPKPISSYQALQAFRAEHQDTIIAALDFELVDHFKQLRSPPPKSYTMSEIGVAVFDPRLASYKNSNFTNLARHIKAEHIIDYQWQWCTEETCTHPDIHPLDNPWQRHYARPYHCQFADSAIKTKDEAFPWLTDFITTLTKQNLTPEEIESGKQRKIKILFWDYRTEMEVLEAEEVDIDLKGLGTDIELWDLQTWSPIVRVFFPDPDDERMRVNCGVAMASLGILGARDEKGDGIIFHNAANDTVAEILAFLRFMTMTRKEWEIWHDDRENLNTVSLDWIDLTIWRGNWEKSQPLPPMPPPPPPPPPAPSPTPSEVWGDSSFADISSEDSSWADSSWVDSSWSDWTDSS